LTEAIMVVCWEKPGTEDPVLFSRTDECWWEILRWTQI